MVWIGLDVHKGFSRMGPFDPAPGAERRPARATPSSIGRTAAYAFLK
jgi:hypothetical protein